MRVVLDSNVYVSAMTLPGGSADIALSAALDGAYVALLSEPILGETLGVLGRRVSRDKEELARVALFLSELTEHVSPGRRITVLDDDPDNRVLECAIEGGAELIVTGDRAMLRLGQFEGVEIVSLRAFPTRLAAPSRTEHGDVAGNNPERPEACTTARRAGARRAHSRNAVVQVLLRPRQVSVSTANRSPAACRRIHAEA